MRLAWFSPMPPARSGIATVSAGLVRALRGEHQIDVFVDESVHPPGPDASAHQFVWRHQQQPYDLIVYQMGNSAHHDFIWPYLFRYPGLTVLHDTHLHHARAATLLRRKQADDYRAEFKVNHPDASADAAELGVKGFDSFLYYMWPMRRLVVERSRLTGVHARAAIEEMREEAPGAAVEYVPLGHGRMVAEADAARARRSVRARLGLAEDAVLFGVFGGLSPEKRLPQILDAFEVIAPYAPSAHLVLAGGSSEHYDIAADVARRAIASRVTITGYLDSDEELTELIAAVDVSLNLRWPTAGEISGPWLQALAAGRATVITDLVQNAEVPALDPRTWTPTIRSQGAGIGEQAVCVSIDILDEDHSLRLAMRRLATDAALRASLGAAAQDYWRREHSLDTMVEAYRRLLPIAASTAVRRAPLPAHLEDDGGTRLRALLEPFGLSSPLG
jgi:glycosyltransferase involved in cell wall biosynthesis